MWNETGLSKRHGLDRFALGELWSRNDHPYARALLLCDAPVNTFIVTSASLLRAAFLTFFCRHGERPGLEETESLRILFNKPRDAGSHSQADVLQDEILHPSSAWLPGPPLRKQNSAKQPFSLMHSPCKPTNQALSQWGFRLLLKMVLRVNTLQMWFSPLGVWSWKEKGLAIFMWLQVPYSVMSNYLPPYTSWFKPFHASWKLQFRVEKVKPSLRHLKGNLIFLNAEHLLKKSSPFRVPADEHPKITTWNFLWLWGSQALCSCEQVFR